MVKSVKLADIAAELNVSVVTVSKALAGQKGVSEELRKKIKDLADEMGYTPIHGSRKEKSKSYTIGVISLESYFAKFASFYWKMYQEIATSAVKKNCFTMLEVISEQDVKSLQPPKLLQEDKVDGIVIIGQPSKEYLKLLYQYKKTPMIFLDFYDGEEDCDFVVSESYYGSYKVTNYLIRKGHRKIAYVGTLMSTESITDRYLGYRKALMEAGIELREDWVIEDREKSGSRTIEKGYRFELPSEMPTAFVCNNDITAYGVIKHLEEAGYRVPEDVSVVGYDDYLHPEYGDSKITTYAVDMAEMSRITLRNLIKKMENVTYNESIHVVPGRLIERETVKDLNQ
ncbi:MAG: LacI family DNA-binding transcriptional regulator [Lachnospiraceae bacterium]|nr:LacI family DNA-binding transcriptional regulator [Lachnospiraceae bacterium]